MSAYDEADTASRRAGAAGSRRHGLRAGGRVFELGLAAMLSAGCAPAMVEEEGPRAVPGDRVRFGRIVLDTTFRSEGVATGNVNRDGRTDLIAGNVWYEAPDTQRRIRRGRAALVEDA